MDMREIPIGVQDFKKIRDNDGYFVDKSPIIDYVLRKFRDVYLFTRPRRFGKSVNLSMIDAYLNMEYLGNTWFDGLRISDIRPDDPLKNSFPVVYLDMRGLGDGGTRGSSSSSHTGCRRCARDTNTSCLPNGWTSRPVHRSTTSTGLHARR